MDWRSSCCSRIARPTSATNGAASSGCDASKAGSFVFAHAPHTCQSVRTWDQEAKELGRTGCNGGYCTTTNDTSKGRTAQSGKKEHPSTGLRRLRPEEASSGPGRCRNGRKRSGADRCARSGPRGPPRPTRPFAARPAVACQDWRCSRGGTSSRPATRWCRAGQASPRFAAVQLDRRNRRALLWAEVGPADDMICACFALACARFEPAGPNGGPPSRWKTIVGGRRYPLRIASDR